MNRLVIPLTASPPWSPCAASLIAEALGVTRQAVHKKHAKRLKVIGVEATKR